jgi:hypothetical protein
LRFYTKQECDEWLRGKERVKPDEDAQNCVERLAYPKEPHRVYSIAHWIATRLSYRLPTLLWVTEWGIWRSSENSHLYYKLRQSYGDHRLLHEAPGHLFLEHESEDLTSFLQIAMLNGWGGYILTQADYVNTFFSHDECIDFYAKREDNLADVRKELGVQVAEKEDPSREATESN